MLFRGLTIDSRLNLLSMVSRSYLSRLVWSHGFVRALPGTHTNNIVPVSSSMHGVFVSGTKSVYIATYIFILKLAYTS